MAYTAPRDAVKERKELFAKSGLELAGVTIAPFVVQNLFRTQWVSTSGISTYADLQLGHSSSRISIFSKENLILTKVIDLGMDSLHLARMPLRLTKNVCWKKVGPALERLTAEIEEVFEYHCGPGKGEPIQKLFVSGPVNPGKAILNHLSEKLGVRIVTVDLLNPANPFLSRVRPPPSLAERSLYASALSLALSDNSRTPNLLCPFDEKEQTCRRARLNRVDALGFGAGFADSGSFIPLAGAPGARRLLSCPN